MPRAGLPSRSKAGRRRGVTLKAGAALLALALVLLVALAAAVEVFAPLPLDAAKPTSRLVLDRHGKILRAYTTQDGRWRLDARPEEVSDIYLSLLLSFEDKRFWQHHGVDPLALARAVGQAIGHGRPVSGGSTLTMQVARLLRGSPTHSGWAKLRQIVDALRLEMALSKRDILALYLKLAPFGGNLEGVRAASLAYFGKEPARLTLADAATLVAIPQSPETRKPGQAEGAALLAARNRVIERAVKRGLISASDARAARAQRLPPRRVEFPILAPHLADRLKEASAAQEGDIRTTLDRALQETAERIARRHAVSLGDKLSVAALIVNHRTGEVLAHVGSAGLFDERRQGAVDMTAAVRSPGSALKPFIYGLAFEDGLAHPETMIEDRPARFDTYAPTNFDNAFRGQVSIRQALQLSLNVPAVKVLAEVGPAKLAARLSETGLGISIPRNLAVALGGAGLSLEQLAALYVGLARGGQAIALTFEKDASAGDHKTAPQEAKTLLQPVAAYYVTSILRGVPAPPTSTPGAVAFKTGTSYGFRDAWAAGFDGEHAIAVWVGRADATSVPGLSGLSSAAPLMFELFGAIGPKRAGFAPAPANIVRAGKAAELPPPLRAFRDRAREAAQLAKASLEPPLHIAFPPADAEVDLPRPGPNGEKPALTLKAAGGTLPLTWLVDGKPIASLPFRREAFVEEPKSGFVQVTVIDAAGRSDRVQIRLR